MLVIKNGTLISMAGIYKEKYDVAIVQARIPRVVIGCMNPKAGCAGSVLDMLHEDGFNHQAEVETGVLGEECSRMMKDFFKELREEGKRKKAEKTEEIKEDSHAGN